MAVAAMMATSCSLDEHPLSSFTDEDAYSNATLIYANCLAGVYTSISNKIYGSGLASVETLQDIASDAVLIPGRQGDWVDGGKWQNIFLHNFDPSVDLYATVWNNMYSLVGLCNNSIDILDKQENNAYAKTYISELRAMRAIFYTYLLDMYGEIPLVTKSNVSMAEVSQSHRSQVFTFIVDELTQSLPDLSDDQSQLSGEYYGRITKPVVYMALLRLALNSPVYTIDNTSKTAYKAFVGPDMTGKATASEVNGAEVTALGNNVKMTVDGTERNAWETVIYCAEKLEGYGYVLEPDYATNFKVSNEVSKENIFIIPNDESSYRIMMSTALFSWHYAHGTVQKSFGANGTCATNHQMIALGCKVDSKGEYISCTDSIRAKNNFYIGTDYTEYTGGALAYDTDGSVVSYKPLSVMVDFPSGSDAGLLRQAGARYKKYEFDSQAASPFYPNNDIVLWRYADAVLSKAEALYRLGRKDEALVCLNQVRSRAGLEEKTSITLEDINVERLCEFSWEAIRRTDEVRLATFTEPTEDRYVGVWKNASANEYRNDTEGYTCVFPIPTDVLSLNPLLTQNPGY